MNEWETVKRIYTILNKETGEFYKCRSGKVGWVSSGAAKNAFKLCTGTHFDLQGVYKVVALGESNGKT